MVVHVEYLACCCTNIPLLDRFSEASRNRLWRKMAPCNFQADAEPVFSKPPAGVDVRIFTGDKCDFGASTPLLTRASSLHIVRAESPAVPADRVVMDPDRRDISQSSVWCKVILTFASHSCLEMRLPSRRDVAA